MFCLQPTTIYFNVEKKIIKNLTKSINFLLGWNIQLIEFHIGKAAHMFPYAEKN